METNGHAGCFSEDRQEKTVAIYSTFGAIQRLVRAANEEKARETVSDHEGCHKSTSSQVKTRTRYIRKPQRYSYE